MTTTVRFFISLLFVLLCNQVFAMPNKGVITAEVIPVIHFPTDHGPNRTPAMISAPDVYYLPSQYCLAFIAHSDVNFTFSLKDVRGRIILTSTLSLSEGDVYSFNVSHLLDGEYFIELLFGDYTIEGSFIK